MNHTANASTLNHNHNDKLNKSDVFPISRPVSPNASSLSPVDSPLPHGENDLEKEPSHLHVPAPEQFETSLDGPRHPRAGVSNFRWTVTLLGQYTGALLFGLDTTITATVQASIYEDLGSFEKLPWVGVGFPLASVASILLLSKMNETFQIKWIIIASLILFEAGSALCGAAPNMNALIIGRVIAGLGGSGAYIGNLTYLSNFTTLKERPIYLGLTGLTWGIGAILGPVVGGGFAATSATWRWAFYINLPLAVLMAPSFYSFPLLNPIPELNWRQKSATIDWVGVCLNAFVWVFLVIALTMSGSTWAWSSGPAIAFWVLTGVWLVSYIIQQAFSIFTSKANRIFPVKFLARREMVIVFIATAAASSAFAVPLYYIPLFFQFTRGDTPLEAAVRLLPYILLYIVFVMLAGGSLPAVGRYAPYYTAGGVLMLIGGALMATCVQVNTANANIYGYTVLIGIGAGLTFQNGYSVAAAIVVPGAKEDGQAIGFINTAQVGCIALALSMAGCIYQNVGFNDLAAALASYNLPESAVRGALAGADSVLIQEGGPIRDLALATIVGTMSKLYWMVVAAGALLIAVSPAMRWGRLKLEMGAA